MSSLVNTLRKAVGLLDASHAGLKATVLRQCDLIDQPTLRITVFGPFNYGKSTLLNALLGEKTLPIDLVPTTGTVITVSYGAALTSRISLADGTTLEAPGTDLLKRYAILDDQRHMRQDVTAVEVQCPHPFLQSGVELVDLPGTDDHAIQNELVHTQLLEADAVIQLLDGRKLMTLTEREHPRDWLLERGVTTVIFVVNFLNLMESEERQQVLYRLRFVAQDFRATLPDGVSNLYAVDALPALRARLKGNMAAATQAGLPALESALQTLVQERLPQIKTHRLPRLLPLAAQVQQILQQQLAALAPPSDRRIEIKQRVKVLLQTGFQQSVGEFQDWLRLDNLLNQYQSSFAMAIEAGAAVQWLEATLQPEWKQKKRTVTEWVYKACDFFEQPRPVDLWIDWHKSKFSQSENTKFSLEASNEAAHTYLTHFSKTSLEVLNSYKVTANKILQTPIVAPSSQTQHNGQRLLLENILADLQQIQLEND
ncbi:MAG: dynamin family protein [Cyanobacteria bacterium P01_A01_bin.137]